MFRPITPPGTGGVIQFPTALRGVDIGRRRFVASEKS
jgi:hypothetical protein